MRLTLRTLLAYLDDVLTPQDRQQLEQRIAASEFASDLIHRTHDAMRRIRLGAPEVLGDGVGADPNSVAEYLDNTMAPELVGEFELTCLDRNNPAADAHLAEAAACHHILTMVLDQPAEIDPAARQRMYTLLEVAADKQRSIEAALAAPGPLADASIGSLVGGVEAAGPAAVAGAVAAGASARRAEGVSQAPQYLMQGRRTPWVAIAQALAAVLLLGIVSYIAFRPEGPLGRALGLKQDQVGEDESPSPDKSSSEGEPVQKPPESEPAAETVDGGKTPSPTDQEDAGTENNATPEKEIEPVSADPEPAETTEGGEQTAADNNRKKDLGPRSPADSPAATPEPSNGVADPAEVTPPDNGKVVPSPSEAAAPPKETLDPKTPAEAASPAADEEDVSAKPPAPAVPRVIGMTLPAREVLLRFDPSEASWRRIPGRERLLTGERVLALPTYDPSLNLDGRLNVQLRGGCSARLGESQGAPLLQIEYGRAIVTNTSLDPARLVLQVAENQSEIELAPGAELAVESYRRPLSGIDPIVQPLPTITSFFLKSGSDPSQWTSGEDVVEVAADSVSTWTLEDGGLTVDDPPVAPQWLTESSQLNEFEREASLRIEGALVAGEPAWPVLRKMLDSHRQEDRFLAANCSMHVGNFEPFVKALADPDQKMNWDREIEGMRVFMSLSDQLAKELRSELEEQVSGESQGAELYEMFVGYSPQQLGRSKEQQQVGPLAELIRRLENDRLEYRVLANHNLTQISGGKTLFNPTGTETDRERKVKRLREMLESGDFVAPRGAGAPAS